MMSTDARCASCGTPVEASPDGHPCPRCGDTNRIIPAVGTATARVTAAAEAQVKRGQTFWGCAHWLFALLLGVEGFAVSVLPIEWWARVIIFLCLAGITAGSIYESPTVHNQIARLKGYIEDRFR